MNTIDSYIQKTKDKDGGQRRTKAYAFPENNVILVQKSEKDFVDLPLIIKSPLVYWSKPPIMLSKVVLPQPDCPSIDTNSELLKDKSTPFKALTVESPLI